MPALAIIADDLTAALDAAAPFASLGAVMAARPEALPRALETASAGGVVAVSTRSREAAPEAARAAVAGVRAALPEGLRIVKKVVSRLKGNIAAELSALEGEAVLLPGIPDFRRTVEGSHVRGFGVARPIPAAACLGGRAAAIPDTRTQAEMARAVAEAPEGALLIGARGMVQALAARMGAEPATAPTRLPARTCFAIGSQDPITAAQVLRLAEAGARLIDAPHARVPLPGGADGPVVIRATDVAGLRLPEAARRFARGIRPWAEIAQALVLSGGATAEAVLDALGPDLLYVAGEAEPGLPLCHAEW